MTRLMDLSSERSQQPSAYSQRITGNDIRSGQVRIPADGKTLFPPVRSQVDVDFLGQRRSCRWDPRFGPDQERSGVLGAGRALMKLARQEEILAIAHGDGGVVRLSR